MRSEVVRSVNLAKDMCRRDQNSVNLGNVVHMGFAEVLFQSSVHRGSEACNFHSTFEAVLS